MQDSVTWQGEVQGGAGNDAVADLLRSEMDEEVHCNTSPISVHLGPPSWWARALVRFIVFALYTSILGDI